MTEQSRATPISGNRVIIVEDDYSIRKNMVDYLTIVGYEVAGVGSAVEFYQQLAAGLPYAVAIFDVGLPDQNGLVLAEYVRNNTGMRIIMYTARASIEDKIAGHEAGADIYLVKPVDLRELSLSIASLLRRIPDSAGKALTPGSEKRSEPASWRVVCNSWILQTPEGKTIPLTAKELDFIKLLVTDGTYVAGRLDLLKKLGYNNNESGHRALEAIVNRLRRKITDIESDNPIKTAHGVGYAFSGNIVIE
ncbi:MAG: response regulator transcription factor [Chlorobiaceae bacterium]